MNKEGSVRLEHASGVAATSDIRVLDTAANLGESKAFATLAAHFALQGFELIKGDSDAYNKAPYYAGHWKLGMQPLADLCAAEGYLVKVMVGGDGAG